MSIFLLKSVLAIITAALAITGMIPLFEIFGRSKNRYNSDTMKRVHRFSCIRSYLRYYENAKMIGLIMALLTFGLVGTSAGYYLVVSDFGTNSSYDTSMQYNKQLALAKRPDKDTAAQRTIVKTDPGSIGRGKNLFDSNCNFCHHDNSTETIVGPGLKGILKKPRLPVSNRPATPDNVVRQLRHPFNRMPSFDYLTDREISDILAYLNTL
jgi:mono/diheme cytochrome c family protein